MKKEAWGPATPEAIAFEHMMLAERKSFARRMSLHLYGRREIIVRWTCPTYTLRKRAMYGGRKGRAAIRRLKALGCMPIMRPPQLSAEK